MPFSHQYWFPASFEHTVVKTGCPANSTWSFWSRQKFIAGFRISPAPLRAW